MPIHLFDAILSNDCTLVKQALAAGADPDTRARYTDIDALMLAAIHRQPETIQLLLAAGANPRSRSNALYAQFQAIDFACNSGCASTVIALLSNPHCRLPTCSTVFNSNVQSALRCCSTPLLRAPAYGPESVRVFASRLLRYKWPARTLAEIIANASWSTARDKLYSDATRATTRTCMYVANRLHANAINPTLRPTLPALPYELWWHIFEQTNWFVPSKCR